MGKHRKLRNGVNQVQNYAIEPENLNQEIPEDFLTSDDFCIVQKKKNKRVLDTPDFEAVYRSQSDLKENGNDNSGISHTGFWANKLNSPSKDSLVPSTSDAFELQFCEKQENNFEVSNPNDDLLKSELVLKVCSETIDAHCENPLPNSIECKNTKCVSALHDNLKNEMSFDKNVVTQTVCSSKKKNKKKDARKKSVEEEVEKILRELEIDDKPTVKPKKKTVISTSTCTKSSLQFTLKDNSIDLTSKVKDSCGEKEISSELSKTDFMSGDKRDVDLQNLEIKEDKANLEKSGKAESKIDNVHTLKRKHKGKSKQKLSQDEKSKCIDFDQVNLTDACEKSENDSEVNKEKLTRSKSFEESDMKGKKKRPSKKQLALIHEALRKAKEEEELLKREAELKQRMAEEAERIRQEKLREEQEKKEKKKLKEKQRREKMKAEGRLLSKSQKQSRARMEATLAAFRQQGIDVPQIGDKRPSGSHGPRLGNCKNFHRKRYDSCQSTQSNDSVVSMRQKSASFSSQESKESLSDFPSSFDSTNELSTTPESDKGIFSYSEESDGLDDIISAVHNEYEKKATKKLTRVLSDVKSLESNNEISSVKYRSPVVCVLGHVDTGKTKLLDYIRKTHIQDSEAGGITQQIGATMIPQDALKEKCKMVQNFSSLKMKIPGLLVIDTPGHESFSNLRSRGSSICDIAILVVDIMHGLEPQTVESINLLKNGKIPFVVALNKVDRLYGWKSAKDEDIETTIHNQSQATVTEFKKRYQEIVLQFANHCLNVALFYENKDPRSYVSMVPTSAVTGDGMGNVLSTVAQLTQSLMSKKLIYSDELEATVLEVKAIPGLGTTIDVILVNGQLKEGDTIVLAGQDGPLVTQIRSLLMPQPLKELRVKNPYIEYKAIKGAQGIKITGKDLEKTIAGLPLLVASDHGMVEFLKDDINRLFRDTVNSIKTSERGVYVQASTLGSLEALLNFLSASGIPYFNVKIGPVVKKDVMKASIMLEHDISYAAILAFDVKIERDAQDLADTLGVHIFHADIIYHLFDMYIKFRDDLLLKQHEEIKRQAIFPCKLRILPDFIFSPRDPIVLGVCVEQGSLKEGTPICVPSKDVLEIGTVSSIEMNNNKTSCAKKGDKVCIKIDPKPGETPKTYGKHFSHEDVLVSRISRRSIDVCKEHFRNDLQSSDWHLIVELKKLLHIV